MKAQLTLLASLALTLNLSAQETKLPPPADKTGVTYATDLKPIFDANCIKCHGEQKPKARLRMDSLAGILKGAKSGKIVTPGDSANSYLVKTIAHATPDKDEWMPPMPNKAGAKTLTPAEIGLVRAWIDQGAK